MDKDTTLKRLIGIVERNASQTLNQVMNTPPEDACWVDGDKCPFGFPRGRFLDRPTSFCHLEEGGCKRLQVVGIELQCQESEKSLRSRIEKETVTLTSELTVIAENLAEGPEQEVLELAADIIAGKLDRDIVLVDNL